MGSQSLIPAKAGTEVAERLIFEGCPSTVLPASLSPMIWAPAFAGVSGIG